MSSAVLDPPRTSEPEPEWVVLDESWRWNQPISRGVQMRGHGADRYGLIPSGGITAARPNLVALPSVDDLDS